MHLLSVVMVLNNVHFSLRFQCEDLLFELSLQPAERRFAHISLISLMSDIYTMLLNLMRFLQSLYEKECRRCYVSFTIGKMVSNSMVIG